MRPCMLLKRVLVMLMSCYTMSLPIEKRVSRAINWEACEFGDSLQTYNEDCTDGATNLLPCNPGQLKVAECIGQDGDTSRVCDPCPQKFFQSHYNKCTGCHECSECGPNKQIKQPCTDETDTVCESIIPPDPVPTTTSRPTSTQATTRASTQSTTYTSMATTEVSLAGTKSTHAVTYTNLGITEIQTLSTTLAEKEEPKRVYKGIDVLGLTVSASVLIIILFVAVVVLLTITLKQREKIKELKKRLDKSNESSGLGTCSSGGDHKTSPNEYEMDTCEEFSQNLDESQPKESMVQVHRDPESNQGSPSKSLERQRSTGEGREESGSNAGSQNGKKSGNIDMNDADMRKDGGGGEDFDGKEIADRPRGTAPSTSGGSGTGDSDGSSATGPDKYDVGAVVDPPKPLACSSATSRPKEQQSDEADPLMEPQAVPKKGHKRKGREACSLMRIQVPGWKKSGYENG